MADLFVNLCFHGVGSPRRQLEVGEESYWIGANRLLEILDAIKEFDSVRLSIDDGNISDVEFILPALVERSMEANFFVLAGRIGKSGSLKAGDVGALREAGMVVGSHGFAHRPWVGLTEPQLFEELVVARDMISSAAGGAVEKAACPLGRCDERALSLLHELGYSTVFTSSREAVVADAWLQPRFSIRSSDTAQSVRRLVLLALAIGRAKIDQTELGAGSTNEASKSAPS